MRSSFRHSVSTKVGLLFAAAVVLLFVLGLTIHQSGKAIIRREIIHSEYLQNRHGAETLVREFRRVAVLQYDLANNADLISLSTIPYSQFDYDVFQMISRVEDKILAIRDSSTLIREIGVLVPLTGLRISTASTGPFTPEDRDLLERYGSMDHKPIVASDDGLLVVSEFPEHYYHLKMPPLVLIRAWIPRESLIAFLDAMSFEGERNGVLSSALRGMHVHNGKDDAVMRALTHRGSSADAADGPGVPRVTTMNTSENRFPTRVFHPVIDGERYIVIQTDTGLSDLQLSRYVSERSALARLQRYRAFLWMLCVGALVSTALFAVVFYRTLHEPLHVLIGAFERLKRLDFPVTITRTADDEFRYVYESFDHMAAQLETLIEQVYRQRLALERSKLKQLQSQINPHFLYNSFLLLRNRIQREDIEFASDFCDHLGTYFMYITRNRDDLVPLREEVEHTWAYAAIQHARFRHRVELEIGDLPEGWHGALVPKIILQPIVENAFTHAFGDRTTGGVLTIAFTSHADRLTVRVEDNGPITDDAIAQLATTLTAPDAEVTGLVNVARRLSMTFGPAGGLSVHRSRHGGLAVDVTIRAGATTTPDGQTADQRMDVREGSAPCTDS